MHKVLAPLAFAVLLVSVMVCVGITRGVRSVWAGPPVSHSIAVVAMSVTEAGLVYVMTADGQIYCWDQARRAEWRPLGRFSPPVCRSH